MDEKIFYIIRRVEQCDIFTQAQCYEIIFSVMGTCKNLTQISRFIDLMYEKLKAV